MTSFLKPSRSCHSRVYRGSVYMDIWQSSRIIGARIRRYSLRVSLVTRLSCAVINRAPYISSVRVSAHAVMKSNLASLPGRCVCKERRISTASARKGSGKALVFHGIKNTICHERPRFSYSHAYLEFIFCAEWYLFLERVTYRGQDRLATLPDYTHLCNS